MPSRRLWHGLAITPDMQLAVPSMPSKTTTITITLSDRGTTRAAGGAAASVVVTVYNRAQKNTAFSGTKIRTTVTRLMDRHQAHAGAMAVLSPQSCLVALALTSCQVPWLYHFFLN